MISLQDKITKFQKLLYNKQLDDFIPIDENFTGTGITMDSLIKQNAFILNQMKKLKSVFNNYCKLNQTVYEKIIQHQLSLHAETTNIMNISQAINRKLDDSLGQVKSMYEEMQYQSVKTERFVQDSIKPISEAVNKKVDESSFTFHMKKIINQLEYGDISPDDNDQKSQTTFNIIEGSSEGNGRKRRSKFISYEEYQLEKSAIHTALLQLSSQIQRLQYKSQQSEAILYKNTASISKITLAVDNNQNQIFKIARQAKDTRQVIQSLEKRLMEEITQRTSDGVWESKLHDFQKEFVSPKYQSLRDEINQYKTQNSRCFVELQLKFIPIQQNIERLAEENKSQFNLITLHKQQHTKTTQSIHSHFLKVEQTIHSLQQSHRNNQDQLNERIQSETQLRRKQIVLMDNKIDELTKTIEEQVFATVKKNIQAKITQIDQNIHSLKTKQQRIDQQLLHTNGQIQSIKEVVSKKANFTDILIHFEKKADKQDIKQLKEKIQTTPSSQLKTTLMESVQKTRRTISAHSRSKRSSNLTKNLLNVSNIMHEDNKSLTSEREMNSRLFIMGLQNDMGLVTDRRMSGTEGTRFNKRIKSTVATMKLLS